MKSARMRWMRTEAEVPVVQECVLSHLRFNHFSVKTHFSKDALLCREPPLIPRFAPSVFYNPQTRRVGKAARRNQARKRRVHDPPT